LHWVSTSPLATWNLALFIDTQHHCMVGRIEVGPDDIVHFLDKKRII